MQFIFGFKIFKRKSIFIFYQLWRMFFSKTKVVAILVFFQVFLQTIDANEEVYNKLTPKYLQKKGYKFNTTKDILINQKNIGDIANYTFSKFKVLKKLNLGVNKLKTIRAGMFASPEGVENNLVEMRELYLFENQIDTIEPGSFKYLKNLELLMLAANEIAQLNGDEFLGLDDLININLTGNKLETLLFKPFRNMKKLLYISLRLNPLKYIEHYFMNKFWPGEPLLDIIEKDLEVVFPRLEEEKKETIVMKTEEL